MRHLRCLRTAAFLLAFSTLALASGAVYAHDGSAHASTGLSEAARLASASPLGAGPVESFSGWFHIIYGDAPAGSGVPATSGYVLVDDHDQTIELLLDEQALRALGGGQGDQPSASHRDGASGHGVARGGAGGPAALGRAGAPARRASTHRRRRRGGAGSEWASGLGYGPLPVRGLRWGHAAPRLVVQHADAGHHAPGLDHYFRELSFNNVNLTGSAVCGWYTLPQPRSYYVYGSPAQLDFQRAANDCTGVADADVYFPGFVGINLLFNSDLDGFAWGGKLDIDARRANQNLSHDLGPPLGIREPGSDRSRDGARVRASTLLRSLHRDLRLPMGRHERYLGQLPAVRPDLRLRRSPHDLVPQRHPRVDPERPEVRRGARHQPDHHDGAPRPTHVRHQLPDGPASDRRVDHPVLFGRGPALRRIRREAPPGRPW